MPDRYLDAQLWVRQGCRPLVCRAGTKHPARRWTVYETRDPTTVELHQWWTGTRRNNENVALILGPPPGGNLLAVNVNVKNGHDGPGTLQRLGWEILPTPTIRTGSGGLCYFFKVPDRQVYPFPFNTYDDTGFDGIKFRGAGGIQVVPTSRTIAGIYEFVPPWTLERFRADLAELPGCILQAQTSSRFCLPRCGLKPTVLDGRKSSNIHARPLTR